MVLDSQVALVTVLSTLDSYQDPICLLGFPHLFRFVAIER